MNVTSIINRLQRVEKESKRLSIIIGLGDDIETIVNNIKTHKIKEEYKELVTSIAKYCIEHLEWLLENELVEFISNYKTETTSEEIIQSVIDKYETKELKLEHINILKRIFKKDDNFYSNLDISLETALVVHVYNGINLSKLRKYNISNKLESKCYSIAIAIYGLQFIYSNCSEISKFSQDIKLYPNMIDSMLRQGLEYEEYLVNKLNILFKDVIKEKEVYRQFISNKEDFDKIINSLLNLDSLICANFDTERYNFWKEYIAVGEYIIDKVSQILTIKFEKKFIVEQGGWQGGYAYILNNSRYEYITKFIRDYDLSSVKQELNGINLDWNEYRKKHTGNWQDNIGKILNDHNIYTDKSKMIYYNREREERRKMTPSLRYKILVRDKYTCKYCGKLLKDEKFHIDHIDPVSRGGKTEESNLITACVHCNLTKGAKTLEEMGINREDLFKT